jgi:hypothetical protein
VEKRTTALTRDCDTFEVSNCENHTTARLAAQDGFSFFSATVAEADCGMHRAQLLSPTTEVQFMTAVGT